jgi:hypothetical protein
MRDFTRKQLKEMSRTKLVDIAYKAIQKQRRMNRVMFYDVPKEIIQELFQESFNYKYKRDEFFAGMRFIEEYGKRCVDELNEINDWEEYEDVKESWGYANWYKSLRVSYPNINDK